MTRTRYPKQKENFSLMTAVNVIEYVLTVGFIYV